MKSKSTQNQFPLVSVIVPNYNHAQFLEQRLQSILSQTYQNFEVIILDDKSTDNSIDVINKYSDHPKVSHVVINKENSGNTFCQWSKGINLSKGSVIWIAESDDYCKPTLLEELINAYKKHDGTVLSYSKVTVVNEHGEQQSWYKESRNRYYTGAQYLKRYLLLGNMVRNASCAIFSKEVALSIPKDFINFRGAGDYLFWVRIAAKGRVAIVNRNLSYFRRHSSVVTARCDRDGSNFDAEKKIFDIISSSLNISYFREILAYTNRAKRISWVKFDSQQIEERINDIWKCDKYSSFFPASLNRMANSLRLRYNYFI